MYMAKKMSLNPLKTSWYLVGVFIQDLLSPDIRNEVEHTVSGTYGRKVYAKLYENYSSMFDTVGFKELEMKVVEYNKSTFNPKVWKAKPWFETHSSGVKKDLQQLLEHQRFIAQNQVSQRSNEGT